MEERVPSEESESVAMISSLRLPSDETFLTRGFFLQEFYKFVKFLLTSIFVLFSN